jgi:GNAT superfamily N-acetyltransferase
MNEHEISRLVELSEARAYASLLQGDATSQNIGEGGFQAHWHGSAVALVAPSITTSLNMNRVIGLGVGEPASSDLVDSVAQHYKAQGLSFCIELAPFAQPRVQLQSWLRARGMRRTVATAMHCRSSLDALPLPIPSAGLKVVLATGAQAQRAAEICCSVFRMPAALQPVIAAAATQASWRIWLAYHNEQPIAAALCFVQGDVAWLGWDATLPAGRGLGAHAALIAHRVNDALEAGCKHVTCETAVHTDARTDASHRHYHKMGFVLAHERLTYVAIQKAAFAPGHGLTPHRQPHVVA